MKKRRETIKLTPKAEAYLRRVCGPGRLYVDEIDPNALRLLDRAAKRAGMTRTEAINRLIEDNPLLLRAMERRLRREAARRRRRP